MDLGIVDHASAQWQDFCSVEKYLHYSFQFWRMLIKIFTQEGMKEEGSLAE